MKLSHIIILTAISACGYHNNNHNQLHFSTAQDTNKEKYVVKITPISTVTSPSRAWQFQTCAINDISTTNLDVESCVSTFKDESNQDMTFTLADLKSQLTEISPELLYSTKTHQSLHQNYQSTIAKMGAQRLAAQVASGGIAIGGGVVSAHITRNALALPDKHKSVTTQFNTMETEYNRLVHTLHQLNSDIDRNHQNVHIYHKRNQLIQQDDIAHGYLKSYFGLDNLDEINSTHQTYTHKLRRLSSDLKLRAKSSTPIYQDTLNFLNQDFIDFYIKHFPQKITSAEVRIMINNAIWVEANQDHFSRTINKWIAAGHQPDRIFRERIIDHFYTFNQLENQLDQGDIWFFDNQKTAIKRLHYQGPENIAEFKAALTDPNSATTVYSNILDFLDNQGVSPSYKKLTEWLSTYRSLIPNHGQFLAQLDAVRGTPEFNTLVAKNTNLLETATAKLTKLERSHKYYSHTLSQNHKIKQQLSSQVDSIATTIRRTPIKIGALVMATAGLSIGAYRLIQHHIHHHNQPQPATHPAKSSATNADDIHLHTAVVLNSLKSILNLDQPYHQVIVMPPHLQTQLILAGIGEWLNAGRGDANNYLSTPYSQVKSVCLNQTDECFSLSTLVAL